MKMKWSISAVHNAFWIDGGTVCMNVLNVHLATTVMNWLVSNSRIQNLELDIVNGYIYKENTHGKNRWILQA